MSIENKILMEELNKLETKIEQNNILNSSLDEFRKDIKVLFLKIVSNKINYSLQEINSEISSIQDIKELFLNKKLISKNTPLFFLYNGTLLDNNSKLNDINKHIVCFNIDNVSNY